MPDVAIATADWTHDLLPQRAQQVLRFAASLDPTVPINQSSIRTAAIDDAIKRVRAVYAYKFGIGNDIKQRS